MLYCLIAFEIGIEAKVILFDEDHHITIDLVEELIGFDLDAAIAEEDPVGEFDVLIVVSAVDAVDK